MTLTKYKLGDLIYEITRRNEELKYNLDYVRGISNTKEIMPTKAGVDNSVIHKFYIINPKEFIYNPRTTRMGEKVGLAFNDTDTPLLFSFNNIAFAIKPEKKNVLLPEYLYIYFNRSEFDRYAIMNSWGSATELFTFEEMCDMEISLPAVSVQQKYVDIYNALLANQKSYERGLSDLKLTCDAYIDQLKHNLKGVTLGSIIEESDCINEAGEILNVQGVNKDKQFMPTVASGSDLRKYKVVKEGQFACNLMHIGRDVAVPISLNTSKEAIIVSPAYLVFSIKNREVLPEYVLMWLSRTETDRNAWFMSDTSVRSGMEKKRFYEIEIPIPDIKIQKAIADIYTAYTTRKQINEKLKAQIKDICPILIKGSLED